MVLRVIDFGSCSPAAPQAMAYRLAGKLMPGGDPAVILGEPREPFLSVGANQSLERDIDPAYCRERGIPILRRRLGGGALYIDRDQVIFHLVVPAQPAFRRLATLATPVLDTYRDLGIAAACRSPGDVVVGGRKIGGMAGAEIANAIVVGGIFIFDFDAGIMGGCLKIPSERLRTRLAKFIERGMTTMRRELGVPPARAVVKAQFVANLARFFGAAPKGAVQ